MSSSQTCKSHNYLIKKLIFPEKQSRSYPINNDKLEKNDVYILFNNLLILLNVSKLFLNFATPEHPDKHSFYGTMASGYVINGCDKDKR